MTGSRPDGARPAASIATLPVVEPQTTATVSSATPTCGAAAVEIRTSAAPNSPPENCHQGGRPSARRRAIARGIAPVASTTASAASIATRLLIVDATVAESSWRPSRPLRYDWSEIMLPATNVTATARAGVASRAAGPRERETVVDKG